MSVKLFTLGNQKPNFVAGSAILKAIIACLEGVTEKFLKNVFTLTIPLMTTVELMTAILLLFNNVKHMSSWRKEKAFSNIKLKTSYPTGINEKGVLILKQKHA